MMNKKNLSLALLCILFAIPSLTASAQSTITFKVNLKPLMEDSVFVPGRDVAKITGNIMPLTRGITLKDESPQDSIYTAEVNFSRSYSGKKLSYNFVLETEPKTIRESRPRTLAIRSGKYDLDALYFDAFAW